MGVNERPSTLKLVPVLTTLYRPGLHYNQELWGHGVGWIRN